jgi:hypothetical protein
VERPAGFGGRAAFAFFADAGEDFGGLAAFPDLGALTALDAGLDDGFGAFAGDFARAVPTGFEDLGLGRLFRLTVFFRVFFLVGDLIPRYRVPVCYGPGTYNECLP